MPETYPFTPEAEAQLVALGSVDLVVGVVAPDRGEETAAALEAARTGLQSHFPALRSAVLHAHAGGPPAVASATEGETPLVELPCRGRGPGPTTWSRPAALRLLFEASHRLKARGTALLEAGTSSHSDEWVDRLLRPILDRDQDLVAPYYLRHPYSGAVIGGILAPLVRALYGRRLRFPLGVDLACSARLVERQLAPERGGGAEPPSFELRLLTHAVAGNMLTCQAVLGTRTVVSADAPGGLTGILADVLSRVFNEMERSAPLWQKVRGSTPAELVGRLDPAEIEPVSVDVARLLDAYRLGQKNLPEVWRYVLPPSTLLELKKLARVPDAEFRLPDRLWARIVYDFAMAYHTRSMSRDHLMGALAPLYLGWFGSLAAEMGDADPVRLEDRLETLGLQFEAEKPYLISRWRWPDHFNP